MENCSVKKRGWKTYEGKGWADCHFPMFSREEISAEWLGEYFFFYGPANFYHFERKQRRKLPDIGQIGTCIGLHVLGLGLGDFWILGLELLRIKRWFDELEESTWAFRFLEDK